MPSDRALEELAKKLRHEERLLGKMNAFFSDVFQTLGRTVRATGQPPSTDKFKSDLVAMLTEHYKLTMDDFKDTIRSDNGMKAMFGDRSLSTKSIEEAVEVSFGAFITESIQERVEFILETTAADMDLSLSEALEILLEAGEDATPAMLAELAAERMAAKSGGRAAMISLTETQNAAEGAKFLEAEAIAQDEETGDIIEVVTKVWETVGDSKVRSTHADADGQTILANALFTVGGAKLRYPGDTSFNAPLIETINCRCSTGYIVDR